MENYKKETIPYSESLIKEFEKIVKNLNLRENKLLFRDFYVEKNGKLIKNIEIIGKNFAYNSKNSIRVKTNNEMKGIYIFFENEKPDAKPIYIGISKTILRRIKQHFSGRLHNQASLAFIIAKEQHNNGDHEKHSGNRLSFPFEKYRPEIQKRMKNEWGIRIIPIDGNSDYYRMATFEILLSCEFKTKWNTFQPH